MLNRLFHGGHGFVEILGTGAVARVKVAAGVDGVDLLQHLTGQDPAAPHDALYWRFGPQKAIRKGQWKLVAWRDSDTKQDTGWQLYDLEKDIGEKNDLAKAEPGLVAELSGLWQKWDQRSVTPLWHGGGTEDPTAPEGKKKR